MFKHFRLFSEDEARDIASRLTDWEDGLIRGGEKAATIKDNQEIVPRDENHSSWNDIIKIKETFMAHGGAMSYALPYKTTAPKFNRYSGGGTYRRHFDASPMGTADLRTDLSCTVFLNDDYEGGELTLESWDGNQVVAPKGKPGECVVYECGNAHWVTPVTKGERIASIFWMRSLIKDPGQRQLVSQFRQILSKWATSGESLPADGHEYTTLTGIQTALCRMWIDT